MCVSQRRDSGLIARLSMHKAQTAYASTHSAYTPSSLCTWSRTAIASITSPSLQGFLSRLTSYFSPAVNTCRWLQLRVVGSQWLSCVTVTECCDVFFERNLQQRKQHHHCIRAIAVETPCHFCRDPAAGSARSLGRLLALCQAVYGAFPPPTGQKSHLAAQRVHCLVLF